MRTFFALLTFLSVLTLNANAETLEEKLQAAMAADIRTAEEVARDRNRRPAETLAFFQMQDDMRVLELLPGGGWYSKLLAPVLRENGEFYVAIGTDRVRDMLMPEDGFDHIKVLDFDAELVRTEPFGVRDVAPFELDIENLDLVVTFRNMHNFSSAGRMSVNKAVLASLKPGGLYGVVDHTRRHMEPMTSENRRRADPVEIIREALDAGFEMVDFSSLHHRPDDELRYEVGRKTVTGNTDRFTLLFRKPE